MKPNISNFWRSTAILTIFLFILLNFLVGAEGWVGGACVRSLTVSNEDAHAKLTFTNYGFPVRFLRISQVGCFDDQATHYGWFFLGLVSNIVIFSFAGYIVYLFRGRKERGKH